MFVLLITLQNSAQHLLIFDLLTFFCPVAIWSPFELYTCFPRDKLEPHAE